MDSFIQVLIYPSHPLENRNRRLTFCKKLSLSTSFWNIQLCCSYLFYPLLHHPPSPRFPLNNWGLISYPFYSPVVYPGWITAQYCALQTVLRNSMNAIRYCAKRHSANAKMALDSRFTTSILIFKLTKIDKSRNMENPDSVTMSGPKRIYQDAQSTVLSDLTMTFKKKKKMYCWSTTQSNLSPLCWKVTWYK